mgnify:CR=1 FL=1
MFDSGVNAALDGPPPAWSATEEYELQGLVLSLLWSKQALDRINLFKLAAQVLRRECGAICSLSDYS